MVAVKPQLVIRSLNHAASKYGINKSSVITLSFHEIRAIVQKYQESPPDDSSKTIGFIIRKLCEIKDGNLHSNLADCECECIIIGLCTTQAQCGLLLRIPTHGALHNLQMWIKCCITYVFMIIFYWLFLFYNVHVSYCWYD